MMSRAFRLIFGREDKATLEAKIRAAMIERMQSLRVDSLSDGIRELIMITICYHGVANTGIQPLTVFFFFFP